MDTSLAPESTRGPPTCDASTPGLLRTSTHGPHARGGRPRCRCGQNVGRAWFAVHADSAPASPHRQGQRGRCVLSAIGSAQLHVDLLDLREALEQALERGLAPVAGLLVATVRLADHLAAALVDLDPAGLDPVAGGDRLVQVAAEHERGEAELRVVRLVDDLIQVVPRDDGQDGTEDLLLAGPPVVARLREDDRRVVVAGLAHLEGL